MALIICALGALPVADEAARIRRARIGDVAARARTEERTELISSLVAWRRARAIPDLFEEWGAWEPFAIPIPGVPGGWIRARSAEDWRRLKLPNSEATVLLAELDGRGRGLLGPDVLKRSLGGVKEGVSELRSRVLALSRAAGASEAACARWTEAAGRADFWPDPPVSPGLQSMELEFATKVGSFLAGVERGAPSALALGRPLRVYAGGGSARIQIIDAHAMEAAIKSDSDAEIEAAVDRYIEEVAIPRERDLEELAMSASDIEILMSGIGPRRRAEASGRVNAAIWYLAEPARQRVADAPGNRVAYFVAEGADVESLRGLLEGLAKGIVDSALVTKAAAALHPDLAQDVGPALRELTERASGKKAAEKMAKLCASIAESGGKALVATDWTK